MRTATLNRGPSEDTGTFGEFEIDDGWKCHSGELPWRENKTGASCIPDGDYLCVLAGSVKHGNCYHVTGVPGRTDVEIHSANWMGDKAKGLRCELLGCISLGLDVGNLAGQKALLHSGDAVHELTRRMNGESFRLSIRSNAKSNP